ncbi:hypothetical protein [Streptomyces fodineus]|uniref:hypothetical protein n=1 Tax=Streptomyces fodineus TaxID=1904616 RepID=UPI00131A613D|nr:hypothetical protein [Streptomyces fodineus]
MLATAFVAVAAQRSKRNLAPRTVFLAGAASIIAEVLLSTRLAAITSAQVRLGSEASGEKGLVSALIGEHRRGDAALGGRESVISVAGPGPVAARLDARTAQSTPSFTTSRTIRASVT